MNKKVVIIILSVMILGLSIGYAALSSSLNITGSAKLGATADSWNINFKNAKCTAYNYAEAGNIEIKNKTTLELSNSKLKAPKDYIICNFDIVNDGTIDAKVTSITNPDKNKFTYTGSGEDKEKDELIVNYALIAEMKYQDNTEIKLGDELKAKETKKAYIKIKYDDDMPVLPTNEVSISNIFGQIIYGQYKVGDTDITKEVVPHNVGDVVYYNPVSNEMDCTNYTASNSQNENKTGCMKWNVITDNSSNITLMLDHNTTYKVAWYDENATQSSSNKNDLIAIPMGGFAGDNTKGPLTANAKLASDVSGWSSQAKSTARMITADEIWSITSSTNGKSSWSSSTSTISDGFYFNNNASNGQGYAWLFNNTNGCTSYGCDIEDSGTYGYWTSSFVVGSDVQPKSYDLNSKGKIQQMNLKASPLAVISGYAWLVYRDGDLGENGVGNADFIGLRPVITISKS